MRPVIVRPAGHRTGGTACGNSHSATHEKVSEAPARNGPLEQSLHTVSGANVRVTRRFVRANQPCDTLGLTP
jgi:hypothetical protein